MKVSTTTAEHYNWGMDREGWHLLKTPSLIVIQERMPAGSSEQLHYHNTAQQLFYILSGTAAFELDEETITISPFESIHIKPGVKHRIYNTQQEELIFLVISEPMSQGDRINC